MIGRGLLIVLGLLGACRPDGEGELPIEVAREIHPVMMGTPGQNGVPSWRAVYEPGRLLLDSPTSAGWYAIALPPPVQDQARRTISYDSGAIGLMLEIGACATPAYRERLPNRVTLRWDGGSFEGCNGPGKLPPGMAGTMWELTRIGGEVSPEGRSPSATLVFGSDGSLGGTLTCNNGGISRTWREDGRFEGPAEGFLQTQIGCNMPASEAFGMRFWKGMDSATAWRRDGARLRITLGGGSEAELRFLLTDRL